MKFTDLKVFVVIGQLALLTATLSGCAASHSKRIMDASNSAVPRELDKITLPAYVVEPPDILVIQAVSTLRNPNSQLVPGDRLQVQLKNGLPVDIGVDPEANQLQYDAESQIELGFKVLSGTFRVGTDGAVNFGPSYGKIDVAGMTVTEADIAIRNHLKAKIGIKSPQLMVQLVDAETPQPIEGEHLVRPDGRVSLGIYGEVYVAGMTLPEVRDAVKQHLETEGIQNPRISVDVSAYNSKTYYVIADGGGYGETVIRLPYTGNETVLDAISQIQGLPEVSSKRVWIARPAPSGCDDAQILEVAWEDVAALGKTTTNFQVMPGDRIYVQADKLIAADNWLAKILSPFERIAGASILGANVARYTKGIYPITSGVTPP